MPKLELLSPAANYNFGRAAISFGADAVYIGPSRFGARQAAGNSLTDIENLIKFAHPFFAKVYATINTLLFDHEIDEAVKLIWQLYEIGIDGIIVQDLGLLECELPPVKLIASTQMDNFSPDKINFLENAGFSRIILARELSIDEIQFIRNHSSIELEAFIHGSLCVSLSGQCFMSHSLCGKSGNRGQCCQPCRSDYTLISDNGSIIAKSKHLLSLKDLNLSNKIQQLIDAGITSFKIEGRLKDENYVKNITAHYRKIIDTIIDNQESGYHRSSSGKTTFAFEPNPYKSFNRGFTEYFIDGRKEKMSSWLSQKSIGEAIGIAGNANKDGFLLEGAEKLSCGDGLVWFDNKDVLSGGFVNKVSSKYVCLSSTIIPEPGNTVYRNYDKSFNDLLDINPASRKIAIRLLIKHTGNFFIISAIDEDNVHSEFSFFFDAEKAQNTTLAAQSVIKQLKKTGSSIFVAIEAEYNGEYYLPVSMVNQWRRDLLNLHLETRVQQHSYAFQVCNKKAQQFPAPNDFRSLNITNHKAKLFYKRHGIFTDIKGFDIVPMISGVQIMQCRYCLRFELNKCPVHQDSKAGNDHWQIINNKTLYTLKFNCKKCFMEVWSTD